MFWSVPRSRVVPLIIACALFMEHLDSSIIATALPVIAQSLDTSPLHLNLAITSYLFSLAVFIPLSGWLADRFGARTVFRAAIVVFTVGSVFCGLSQNLWELVAARVLQGMGGAMMVPVGRLVVLKTVSRTDLVGAMAWLTIPALIGPVMGPPLGGFIVTYASWRWIFFVNVPIGLLGLALAAVFIKNTREDKSEPLDLRGFLLMALALGGLVFGFETAGRSLVPPWAVTGFIAAGLLCFGLYARHARTLAHPIVDLGLMRFPTYRAAVAGGSLFRVGVGAMPFLLPLMLQVGFGVSPMTSGLLTFAGAIGAIAMKAAASSVIRMFGFRQVLIVNAAVNAVFFAGCALFEPDTRYAAIFAFLLAGGFFRSLQFTAVNVVAYAEIPPALVSRANTFYNMMQQLSLSLGVAAGALLLNFTLRWHGTAQLGPSDFWPAYVALGTLSLLSIISFLRLPHDAGADMSGHAGTAIVRAAANPSAHDDPA